MPSHCSASSTVSLPHSATEAVVLLVSDSAVLSDDEDSVAEDSEDEDVDPDVDEVVSSSIVVELPSVSIPVVLADVLGELEDPTLVDGSGPPVLPVLSSPGTTPSSPHPATAITSTATISLMRAILRPHPIARSQQVASLHVEVRVHEPRRQLARTHVDHDD